MHLPAPVKVVSMGKSILNVLFSLFSCAVIAGQSCCIKQKKLVTFKPPALGEEKLKEELYGGCYTSIIARCG